MAYIPKNKIKTNLYTPGGEFAVEATGVEYVGFYYSLYTGEKYTGKTQNDPPNSLLIELVDSVEGYVQKIDSNKNVSFIVSNFDIKDYPNKSINPFEERNTYFTVTQQSPYQSFYIPNPFYPQPTLDDYSLGVFTRYFTFKENEVKWMEIDKETYKSLSSKDSEWDFAMYIPLKLQWTLKGEEDYVFTTNRNSVLIAEKSFKRRGLREYIREDYLKFYK
jgi:hypothetical protein